MSSSDATWSRTDPAAPAPARELQAPARRASPPDVGLTLVLDNFSPHLTTKTDSRVIDRANVA